MPAAGAPGSDGTSGKSPSANPTNSPSNSPAFAEVSNRPAPAPAPDFSAWPYVDRRSLTADDDVPTAQNFLNTAIASERRGRNADVAAAPSAPFGDVPRAYESAASDTRAKPELQTQNAPSTVAIGIASLPMAPEPTVVPSPASASPSASTRAPEPTVIAAPVVPPAPAQTYVPSPSPAVSDLPLPAEGQVDDIADSPLARLLAAQNSEMQPASGLSVPGNSEPVSTATLEVVPTFEAVGVKSPETGKVPVSNSPFAAPKVGRTESLFDSPLPNDPVPDTAVQVGGLWTGDAQALPHEITPLSATFGVQTLPTRTEAPEPVKQPAQAPEAEPARTVPEVLEVPEVPANSDPEDVTSSEAPSVHHDTQPATNESVEAPQGHISVEAARTVDSSSVASPVVSLEVGSTLVEPSSSESPLFASSESGGLSSSAIQEFEGFDEEHPEDLVPLGVSDRLVLRWQQNAAEDLRVSSVGLSVGWPGAKPLVTKLDIDLQSGDVLVVEGPERSGKTALLKTFAGHLAPLEGDVSLDGQSLGSLGGADVRRREALSLSYVGVNSLLVADLSLVENVELPLLAEGVSPHDARPAALAWLESVGLQNNAHLPAGSLSSSDARIGAVIRTLIVGPPLVCVDDVTSGMGISSARMVLALLEHAQGTGTVLLVATNDSRLEFDGGYRAAIEAGELMPVE